ncbi:hypothetical protein pb186bvf_000429 [Paramecium bursaria]
MFLFRRGNSALQKSQSGVLTPTKPIEIQSPRSGEKFYDNTVKLRENFAQELLNLEMELEQPNVSMETVAGLLNLYREAVEYFEAIQSNKYLIFKNKTQALLTRKNVALAMKLSQVQKPANSDQKVIDQQKQAELKIKLNYISQQDQQSCVNTMIDDHSKKQEKVIQIISQDLQDQNAVIQKRLLQRRNNSIKRDQEPVEQFELNEQKMKTESTEIQFNPNHVPKIRGRN